MDYTNSLLPLILQTDYSSLKGAAMKHSIYYIKITRIFYFIFFLLSIPTTHYSYELRWDWDQINLNALSFPSSFLWGCADSALQTEGTESSNGKIATNSWTEFEKE